MRLLIFLVVQRRAAPLTNRHLTEVRLPILPACLGQARNVAAHAVFTEFNPRKPELTHDAVATRSHRAAIPKTRSGGITRKLLELHCCIRAVTVARIRVLDDPLALHAVG